MDRELISYPDGEEGEGGICINENGRVQSWGCVE